MNGFNPIAAVLGVPILAAALLAVLPGYRLTARLNVLATFLTLLAAGSLFLLPRPPVGPSVRRRPQRRLHPARDVRRLPTSVFSASYIGRGWRRAD
jgi:hydrogenase-4 component F